MEIEDVDRSQPTADARTRRAVLFSVVCVALLVTLANHPTNHSHSRHAKLSARTQRLGPPEPVRVRLYMESKCPACKEYTSEFLKKIIETKGVIQSSRLHHLR